MAHTDRKFIPKFTCIALTLTLFLTALAAVGLRLFRPGGDGIRSPLIDPQGNTLAERIQTPNGYSRPTTEEGSFVQYLRDYPMKPDRSPILLYNGKKAWNQSSHAAVFALDVPSELQQCADSVIRLYADYFWQTGQYDRISFHFTNGFPVEYAKWRDGSRVEVTGNDSRWIERCTAYDDSYENFSRYLDIIYTYAGTLSMSSFETVPVSVSEAQPGDVLIRGGSPGHVVMIVDVCENAEKKRAFLLAQGSTPAQEFHVFTNPKHPKDPWYYEDEIVFPLSTTGYTFEEGALRRMTY